MSKEKMNFFQRVWNALMRSLHRAWKRIEPDPVLNPMQQDVFDIFEIYLNDDNNVRYLEPNTERKYIVSKDYLLKKDMESLFILLDPRRITIIDNHNKHDFDNKFDMHEKTVKRMNEMFDDKVKQDREEMRKDIMSNIKTSLEMILENLKKKQDEK
jgi:hypothetical protein